MTNATKSAVMDAQRRWALAAGHQPDKRGYLENIEDNLFKPLSERALEGLGQGSGSELTDKGHEKAKFRALYSSSALAVNVFDYSIHLVGVRLERECPIVNCD